MNTSDHRAIAVAWNRAWSDGDADALCRLLRDPVVRHASDFGGTVSVADYQERLRGAMTRFTELHWTTDAVVSDGELLAVRGTLRATLANGSPIIRAGLEIWRIEDGKIAEMWSAPLFDGDWTS